MNLKLKARREAYKLDRDAILKNLLGRAKLCKDREALYQVIILELLEHIKDEDLLDEIQFEIYVRTMETYYGHKDLGNDS